MNFEKLPKHPKKHCEIFEPGKEKNSESAPRALKKGPAKAAHFEAKALKDQSHDLDILYSSEKGIGAGDYKKAFHNLGVEMSEEEIDDFATRGTQEKREIASNRLFGKRVGPNMRPNEKQRAMMDDINREDFEDHPEGGKQFRLSFIKRAQQRIRRNEMVLEKVRNREGAFTDFTDEEAADHIAQIEAQIARDRWRITLARSSRANQTEIAEIIDEYKSLEEQDLTDEELAAAEAELFSRVDRMYQAVMAEASQANEKSDSIDEEVAGSVTEEESAEVEQQLALTEGDEIKGKNSSGDVIIALGENIRCAYDIAGAEIEWIKINISGREYLHRAPENSITPGNFRDELGETRLAAVCNYYDLPFDKPNRDKLVEVYRGNAEVRDMVEGEEYDTFDYSEDYTDGFEDDLISFLENLPIHPGESVSEAFVSRGLIVNESDLSTEKLGMLARRWAVLGEDMNTANIQEV
jgi:hypothetical protein